eukprot:Polyplicarium_translucidae@DN2767_c0_g1_i6.p3
MSEWDAVVKEWTVDTGHCYAGALANAEDGAIYACAASTGDAWGLVYKEDYKVDIEDEEGKKKATAINEPGTILTGITEGEAPLGVWIGGVKYKVIRLEKDFEYGDHSFDCLLCARPKAGAHLVKTATANGSIVIVLYDEAQEQTTGNAKICALAFADYLTSEGY